MDEDEQRQMDVCGQMLLDGRGLMDETEWINIGQKSVESRINVKWMSNESQTVIGRTLDESRTDVKRRLIMMADDTTVSNYCDSHNGWRRNGHNARREFCNDGRRPQRWTRTL